MAAGWAGLALAAGGAGSNQVGEHGTELAERSLIVMTFINVPGYIDPAAKPARGELAQGYEREIADMAAMGANAAALDTFNNADNWERVLAFAEAVERHNEQPGVEPFAFFLLLDLPPSIRTGGWNKKDARDLFTAMHNRYYATIGGRPVIATWHGEQKGRNWWKELSDYFAESGPGIFLYH